jgi:hypothetical protein
MSEKFPSMKASYYIYTMVLAAGMLTALADEPKTNTPTDATSTPNTNKVVVPAPMAAPLVANGVKPPVVVPSWQTSAVPVQSNITAAPPASAKAVIPLSMTATSVPAPTVANEGKPPVVVPSWQTSAIPAQSNITAAPPTPAKAVIPLPMSATSAPATAVANEGKPPAVAPLEQTSAIPAQTEITSEPPTPTNAAAPSAESSGNGHKGVWAGGMAVLALAGGLAIFMLRRFRASSGSLITSAMNENQKSHEDKNAPPPMA